MDRALGSDCTSAIFGTRAFFVKTAVRLFRTRAGFLHKTTFRVTVTVRRALQLIIEKETVITRRAFGGFAYVANTSCWNVIGACALP